MTSVKTATYTVQSNDKHLKLHPDEGPTTVYIRPGSSNLKITKALANYYPIVLIGDGCKINNKDIIITCRQPQVMTIELKPDGDNWTYEWYV